MPVCVHLDHGLTDEFVQRGIRAGFTSIMYDCSMLPTEDNVQRLRALVDQVGPLGITVEGEIGVMPSAQVDTHGENDGAPRYTTPEEAARFADQTKVDALAVCFGTSHGVYAKAPNLDIEQLRQIRLAVRPETSLVMHGSSGLSEDQLRSAVAAGCVKVNYYTYLAVEASAKAADIVESSSTPVYFHDLTDAVAGTMRQHAREVISLLQAPSSRG